eukprot:2214938-Alexandrium_andersonii.AAC.1
MSASLVGSEMCIRDSLPAAIQGTGPRHWRHGRSNAQPSREAAWRGAVSYTHLTLPTICSV